MFRLEGDQGAQYTYRQLRRLIRELLIFWRGAAGEGAFTSGRRARNAPSEWNGQKSNIIVNL